MIFLEGIGDVILPCAAAIVVPGILVALIGRRTALLASIVFAATVGVALWLRAAGFFTASPNGWVVAGGFLIAAGLFVSGWRRAPLPGAALVAAVAAWMWQPCVGIHLGSALTLATREPWAAMVPLIAYGIGLSMAPVAIGLLVQTFHSRSGHTRGSGVVWPAVGLVVLALLAAAGWYEEVVARLVQWSVQ